MRNINHIAQNVPVRTAHDYAVEVVKFCRGEAKLTQYSFMKQDNTKKDVTEHNDQSLASVAKAVTAGTKRSVSQALGMSSEQKEVSPKKRVRGVDIANKTERDHTAYATPKPVRKNQVVSIVSTY